MFSVTVSQHFQAIFNIACMLESYENITNANITRLNIPRDILQSKEDTIIHLYRRSLSSIWLVEVCDRFVLLFVARWWWLKLDTEAATKQSYIKKLIDSL